jgi:hypothetical protein
VNRWTLKNLYLKTSLSTTTSGVSGECLEILEITETPDKSPDYSRT